MFAMKDELMCVCMHECAHTHKQNNTNDNLRTKIMREKSNEGKIFLSSLL